MRIVPAVLAAMLLSVTANAEEWTEVESANTELSIQYSKESIERVTPTIKRAKLRFISRTDAPISTVDVYSVVSQLEYHCTQPLEKVLSVEVVPALGAPSRREEVASPVFSEIRHGSNSYRLWLEVCSRLKPKPANSQTP